MTDAAPRSLLRSKLAWAVAILALLVGVYALFGYRVAPGLVRSQAIEYVRATYGRELAIGEVRIDPFALTFEVRDVAFPNADGTPMVGVRRLYADFEVSSLWRRAWTFREVAIEEPAVRAVLRPGGALNLADLAPPTPADAPPPAPDEPLPSVWIESLTVADGRVDYVDRDRARPFEQRFAPVTFALQDFRTTAEGGDFRLAAVSQQQERFEWKGRFALAPRVSSTGEFSVAALRAPGVAAFLGDVLPFGIASGTIDLAGTYRFALGDAVDLELDLPGVKLADLALRARGADVDWVRIPAVAVDGIAVALPESTVAIRRIGVAGLAVDAWLDADGSVNLQRLFAPAAEPVASEPAPTRPPAAAPAAATTATTATPATPATPWRLTLGAFELDDGTLRLEDRMQAPVKRFTVAPLRVRVRDASLDLGRPLPVELSARINDHATFTATGTLTPEPLATTLDVALEGARLSILQPYILPLADLTIRSGTAGLKGRFALRPPGGPEPEVAFAGEVVLANFRSTDNALDEDFLNFGRVEVRKLDVRLAPDGVRIDRIAVRDPYARVVISREQVLNVTAVLDPAGAAAAARAKRELAEARARETPAERRARERAEEKAAAAQEAQRRADAKAGRGAATPASAKTPPDTFPVRIREVRIDGGRLDFADFNVQPNFAADVRQLAGTLSGLSSAPDSRAQVRLAGNVGEFSPVSIEGEIQPFMFDRYTDMGLKFSNISLPIFNPYSGSFAGYSIAKGKLETEIRYLIQDRRLDAKHHVRIDQLEWGEPTAERGEATLPVKFATVLLRDRNGVIDLNLPVTGTLDDPQFRIGPIVWQIVKNLIVKAVTAPFALLGSLFAGSEEAQFVDFAPGSAELDAAAAERLGSLAKALVEKPGLSLEVPIRALPEIDGPALAERRFVAARDAAMRAKLRRPVDDDAPLPAFDSLEPRQRIEILAAVVQKQAGTAPQLPEPPAPPEGASRAEARELRDRAALEWLEKTARDGAVVGPDDYDALGQQRGQAVQRALLANPALEPQRVFLVRNERTTAKDGRARLELGLK